MSTDGGSSDKPSLGVHVVGRGYGECVVLQFPNGPPGVIDCGSRTVGIWLLQFLAKTLGAHSLSFVAVTHPHQDHIEGLSLLLKAYSGRIGGLWVFPGFDSGDVILRFLEYTRLTKRKLRRDSHLFSLSVQREWKKLVELADRHGLTPQRCQEWPEAVVLDGGVTVKCLLPHRSGADKFEWSLLQCAPEWDWIDRYPNVGPVSFGRPPNANAASGVFLVTWGQTHVLLSGDAQKGSWSASPAAECSLPKRLAFLKVGHHGSKNGTPARVLESLSADSQVVITPFVTGDVTLPHNDVVNAIKSRSCAVHITCDPADPDSTGPGAADDDLLEMIAFEMDTGDEDLRSFLENLPICEEVNANRVSFYFDDSGALLGTSEVGANVKVV